MEYKTTGKIIQGVGGLYTIALLHNDTPLDGQTVLCRAKGAFRHEGLTPLPGDDVMVGYDESALVEKDGKAVAAEDGSGLRTACLMKKVLTYWVDYRPLPEGAYRVEAAYCHRMRIGEEQKA
jgi:hypothetical protein